MVVDPTDNSTQIEAADNDPLFLRLIYMIVFYIVYAVSRFVVGLVAVVQFFHLLFTDQPQEDLLRFAKSLTRFIEALVAYLTFVSNAKPFPFAEWPSEERVQNDGE